jgi:hypothetical protein
MTAPSHRPGFIEIDDGAQSSALQLYLLKLGVKRLRCASRLPDTRVAVLIAQRGKPQRSLQCLHLPVLRRLFFPDFRVAIRELPLL